MTPREHFYVGEWLVDMRRLCVQRGSDRRSAEPKVLDLLSVLAERPGYVWTRDQLLDRVWPDTVVLDHALTRTVSELRGLLDDTARDGGIIETVPKRGYRLAAPVRPAAPPDPADPSPTGTETLRTDTPRTKRRHLLAHRARRPDPRPASRLLPRRGPGRRRRSPSVAPGVSGRIGRWRIFNLSPSRLSRSPVRPYVLGA